jgi:hypothetical protein
MTISKSCSNSPTPQGICQYDSVGELGELCRVMVFAVVEKAGTVVMNDGEELDSWSVIINGHVEIDGGASGEPGRALHLGDRSVNLSILPTGDKKTKKLISLNLNLKFENFVIFLFLVSG